MSNIPTLEEEFQQIQQFEYEGRWNTAGPRLEALLTQVQASNDLFLPKILAFSGGLIWKVGQYNKAIKQLQQAYDLAHVLGDSATMADALYHLGEIEYIRHFFWNNPRTKHGYTHHTKALSLRLALRDYAGLADSHSRLGVIQERLGNHSEAYERFQKSVKLADRVNYPEGKSRALTHMGVYHRQNGELETALDFFQQAYAINQQTQKAESLVSSILNVAEARYELNPADDVRLEFFRDSFSFAEEMDFKLVMARAAYLLGTLFLEQDDNRLADLYLKKSLVVCEANNLRMMIPVIEETLAKMDGQ